MWKSMFKFVSQNKWFAVKILGIICLQNKLGDTALHNAAWKNHPEIVQMLLERGARADLQNKENKTAFNMARDPEVGKLLQVRTAIRDDEYNVDDDSD
jgi:hypothetical protein